MLKKLFSAFIVLISLNLFCNSLKPYIWDWQEADAIALIRITSLQEHEFSVAEVIEPIYPNEMDNFILIDHRFVLIETIKIRHIETEIDKKRKAFMDSLKAVQTSHSGNLNSCKKKNSTISSPERFYTNYTIGDTLIAVFFNSQIDTSSIPVLEWKSCDLKAYKLNLAPSLIVKNNKCVFFSDFYSLYNIYVNKHKAFELRDIIDRIKSEIRKKDDPNE